jgi:hypothetical protein
MKKLVLTIIALLAVFTFIRSYSGATTQVDGKIESAQVKSAVLQ